MKDKKQGTFQTDDTVIENKSKIIDLKTENNDFNHLEILSSNLNQKEMDKNNNKNKKITELGVRISGCGIEFEENKDKTLKLKTKMKEIGLILQTGKFSSMIDIYVCRDVFSNKYQVLNLFNSLRQLFLLDRL